MKKGSPKRRFTDCPGPSKKSEAKVGRKAASRVSGIRDHEFREKEILKTCKSRYPTGKRGVIPVMKGKRDRPNVCRAGPKLRAQANRTPWKLNEREKNSQRMPQQAPSSKNVRRRQIIPIEWHCHEEKCTQESK